MSVIEITPSTPVVVASQIAGSELPYKFDLSSVGAQSWQANAFVKANTVLRPTTGNETGFVYVNGASDGQSGAIEPAWATTLAATVKDGSLTLTTSVPPVSGQDTISSATWTQSNPPDATLTISGMANDQFTVSANIGGGTAGNVYTILVLATMASGVIWPVVLILTILPP